MARTPTGPPRPHSSTERLIACLWWLVFLGGMGAGTAFGVVLAFWLALPLLPGLLLIVACWLVGNAAGWRFASQADAALTRRMKKDRKRIPAIPWAMPVPCERGIPRSQVVGRMQSPGPACP